MKTYITHVIGSPRDRGFVDVTDALRAAIEASGISNGRVTVTPAPPARVVVNEGESGLFVDLSTAAERLGPGATFMGATGVTLPAHRGDLLLGEWQRVFVVDPGGASDRPVGVHVAGE